MDLTQLLLVAPVLLFSMVAHEYAHGWAALKQGDDTARALGRLTWNPVKHIDPVMTILLPLMLWFTSGGRFLFGGAKPVPVDPRRYRNYRRGDIIVSMAGIVTNVLIAGACVVLAVVAGAVGQRVPALTETLAILQLMLLTGVQINLLLALFNLLPIPPLDGSHVFKYLLPPAWKLQYEALGRFGFLLLLPLLWFGQPVLQWWLTPVWVFGGFAEQLVAPFRLVSAVL